MEKHVDDLLAINITIALHAMETDGDRPIAERIDLNLNAESAYAILPDILTAIDQRRLYGWMQQERRQMALKAGDIRPETKEEEAARRLQAPDTAQHGTKGRHMTNLMISSSPYTWRRDKMKRDMELIRRIMLRIEEKSDLKHEIITLEDEDEERAGHHIDMLYQSGFINGVRNATYSRPYAQILVKDLSWEGHEFLAALKNETVLGQIRQALTPIELATVPLTILASVAAELGKEWLRRKVGLG